MPDIDVYNKNFLQQSITMYPNEPLWKRVPSYDSDGKRLADFMMLIPGLNKATQTDFKNTIELLERLFIQYNRHVVFIDLNVKLNLLWVSVRSVPGICLELPIKIKEVIPKAMLVAQKV